jgi:ABC-type lipoprotein release transport system permease subunit
MLVVVRLMGVVSGQSVPDAIVALAALIACIVMSVAPLATWIPARRAAHLNPLHALRPA